MIAIASNCLNAKTSDKEIYECCHVIYSHFYAFVFVFMYMKAFEKYCLQEMYD